MIAKTDPVRAATGTAVGFAKISAPGFVAAGPSVLRAKSVFGNSFYFSSTVAPGVEPQGHLMPVFFVHGKSAVEFDYFHTHIVAQRGIFGQTQDR